MLDSKIWHFGYLLRAVTFFPHVLEPNTPSLFQGCTQRDIPSYAVISAGRPQLVARHIEIFHIRNTPDDVWGGMFSYMYYCSATQRVQNKDQVIHFFFLIPPTLKYWLQVLKKVYIFYFYFYFYSARRPLWFVKNVRETKNKKTLA